MITQTNRHDNSTRHQPTNTTTAPTQNYQAVALAE
jgi:hypothetical protein